MSLEEFSIDRYSKQYRNTDVLGLGCLDKFHFMQPTRNSELDIPSGKKISLYFPHTEKS